MDQNDRGDHDQATEQPNNDRDDHDHHPQRINIPSTRLRGHVNHPDLAFSSLGTIESESESDDDENDAYNREDYEFFASTAFDSELGFLEEQYSDDDDDDYDDMDEDDDDELDVDELTYEELIALGEFIGVEERGLSYKEISSCLRPIVSKTTSINESQSSAVDRCVICQIEYEEEGDENLVALHCEHAYHPECITKWLHIKKSCPICGTEVSSSSSSSSSTATNNNANKDL